MTNEQATFVNEKMSVWILKPPITYLLYQEQFPEVKKNVWK